MKIEQALQAGSSVILVLLSWQLFKCLRGMEVPMRGGYRIKRSDRPGLFWGLVTLQSLSLGIFLAVLIFSVR